MGGRSKGCTTKQDRRTLVGLARALFPRLRRENPQWDYADLRQQLDLPDTKFLQELAKILPALWIFT